MASKATATAERIEPETGEVLDVRTEVPVLVDMTMASALAKAELDQQIVTARQFPRSVQRAVENMIGLATMTEDVAQSCIYSLPRADKAIVGPSVRLAEISAQCWGNAVVDAVVVGIDRVNKLITAAGLFHDLETNVKTRTTVSRRISDKKGRLYSDDMIAVTGNAACAIARRNAVLIGIPKGAWSRAYAAAHKIVAGTADTLVAKRKIAIEALEGLGVSKEQIFAALKVKGAMDIDLNGLVVLRGMISALENGEASVEELFTARAGGAVEEVVDPLKDRPPEKSGETATKPKAKAPAKDRPADKPDDKKPPQSAPASIDEAVAQKAEGEAFKRGGEARQRGMMRKAVPPEYRDTKALWEAWLRGYDAGA